MLSRRTRPCLSIRATLWRHPFVNWGRSSKRWPRGLSFPTARGRATSRTPPAAKADSSQPDSRKRDRSPSRASRSEAPQAYSPTAPGDSSSSGSFQSCEDSDSHASPSDVDSEEASSRFPEVTGGRCAPEDTSFLSRALPENGVFCHVLYGTWHLGSSDSGTLACGRRIFWGKKTHYNRMGAWPSDQRSWCKLCRGKLS